MKPALTAGEWEREQSMDEENMGTPLARAIGVAVTSPEYTNRPHTEAVHALAALALYGQPFGFTREDVKWLRRFLYNLRGPAWPYALEGQIEWLQGFIDRIEALLPPETE